MLEVAYANETGLSSVEAVGFRNRLRAGYFAIVPLEVLSASSLSPAAKIVWGVLSRFQGTNGASWPKISTIAAHAGLSLSGTKKAIKELKDKGFLVHSYGERNTFVLQVPIRTIEDFCQRIGHPELIAEVKAGAQSLGPRARKGENKARLETVKTNAAAWQDLDAIPVSDELRRKYANGHAEDAIWNGFLAEHSQTNSDQDKENGAGTEMGTGGYPGGYRHGAQVGTEEYPGVYHQGTQMGPRDEASAQIGSAKAESEDMVLRYIEESLEDKTEDKAEKSLKDLAPNEEESKSEENFQLGEEEKFGLEPKTPSADPDTLEGKASEGNPPAVLVDSSPSAGDPSQSTSTGGFVLDPNTGRVANYADLPPWARQMVAGLLNLRRERENLMNLLPGARGAEMVMIRARIQELEEEIAYNETRLSELLSQETGQTADAAEALVTVGGKTGR